MTSTELIGVLGGYLFLGFILIVLTYVILEIVSQELEDRRIKKEQRKVEDDNFKVVEEFHNGSS